MVPCNVVLGYRDRKTDMPVMLSSTYYTPPSTRAILNLERSSPMCSAADVALAVKNIWSSENSWDYTQVRQRGSQKEMQNKQTNRSVQTHKQLIIWSGNRGVACSCTLFKLHLGLWCNFVLVYTAHVRLWTVGFLTDDSAASQAPGATVQGSVCSEISIQCEEVVTEVAVNCCRVVASWGLLCKQVSSALFQFKVKPAKWN